MQACSVRHIKKALDFGCAQWLDIGCSRDGVMSHNERIFIQPHFEDGLLTIDGYVGRFPAGLLNAWFENDEIRIGDFHVFKPLTYQIFPLLAQLSPTRTIAFRGRGLGALMLDEFLRRARASACRIVVGGVTESDADESPFLQELYKRRGFEIREGPPPFLPRARYTIFLNLAASAVEEL